jgi:hypothetical protein
MTTNKYRGLCHGCFKAVPAHKGYLERIRGRWLLWCSDCYNRSDKSGPEDRACGDRAYEDQCAEICGR